MTLLCQIRMDDIASSVDKCVFFNRCRFILTFGGSCTIIAFCTNFVFYTSKCVLTVSGSIKIT